MSIVVPKRVDTRFRGGMAGVEEIDRRALAAALRAEVEGEVRFDTQARAMYATDASNYRQPPIGVVVPRTLDDVVAVHRVCHAFRAPIVNRGTGTSLSGETVNFAVVIDHSKFLTEIGDVDTSNDTVVVQPGAINEKVNEHTGRWNLVFGPDPSTHSYCTIGGNIGNNSCGMHSVQAQFYGHGPRTSDNVHSLEVVTYDGLRMWVGETSEEELRAIVDAGGRRGRLYRDLYDLMRRYEPSIREKFPPVDRLPRRVSGYNLDELLPESGFNLARALVGTESTCATVLQARLYLTPAMLKRELVVVAYPDVYEAGRQVPWIMEHRPIALEAIDHVLFEDEMDKNMHPSALSELPANDRDGAWLLVQFGADSQEEARELAERFHRDALKHGVQESEISIFDDADQASDLWQVREGGLGATAFPPDGRDHWPGWEDSAVPPERVGDYMADLKRLYDKHGLRGAMYGHVGQGCVHSRISFDLRTADGIRTYRAFMEEAADLVVSYGGTLSGEHGDGQQRAELLPKQYGEEIVDAFREFKRIWDPDWKMNPGKVVDPYRLDEHLKLGADYEPWRPAVKFGYPADEGDFAHATLRCVGVGKCRQPDGVDVMCPSFMVTRDENHTTRGRARLLFEMLQGDVITDGWQSDEVMEALDLCLACKGCTKDCPVDVDMPTLKAEFLHHRWRHRLRPRHAYAFGLIDQVARVASRFPEVANLFAHTPPVAQALKLAAGMTQQRQMPSFAPLTLQQWFRQRGGTRNPHGRKVVLFPDTFNNHFHTDVGVACVEAIEAAGWQVVMPEGHVCCGRPLYDYGFLDLAERYLRRTLEQLREWYREGVPIVGMEPSCLAVFKDELVKLLPHDDDAKRLCASAYHFSEFFREFEIEPPKLERAALLWGHCHHKATGGMDPERELLEQMGVEVESLQAGCCGLAGSWGFESGHYDVSMAAGEQGLLPRVRELPADALVIANGFSCKTQIEQGDTGRRALHVGQVMQLALEHGADGPPGPRPERLYDERRPQPSPARRAARIAAALAVGGAALAGLGLAVRGALD
ncbi:MAG TPA: FAD-linked oxidase C-terminal domain-containing protein [Gaiellaceae bacterium]|nr:FAD-linked oxidase C-terminal domain-containing protein [Gaiellaceae bacterium]